MAKMTRKRTSLAPPPASVLPSDVTSPSASKRPRVSLASGAASLSPLPSVNAPLSAPSQHLISTSTDLAVPPQSASTPHDVSLKPSNSDPLSLFRSETPSAFAPADPPTYLRETTRDLLGLDFGPSLIDFTSPPSSSRTSLPAPQSPPRPASPLPPIPSTANSVSAPTDDLLDFRTVYNMSDEDLRSALDLVRGEEGFVDFVKRVGDIVGWGGRDAALNR